MKYLSCKVSPEKCVVQLGDHSTSFDLIHHIYQKFDFLMIGGDYMCELSVQVLSLLINKMSTDSSISRLNCSIINWAVIGSTLTGTGFGGTSPLPVEEGNTICSPIMQPVCFQRTPVHHKPNVFLCTRARKFPVCCRNHSSV